MMEEMEEDPLRCTQIPVSLLTMTLTPSILTMMTTTPGDDLTQPNQEGFRKGPDKRAEQKVQRRTTIETHRKHNTG
jgi:hypothetical protein